MKRADAVPVPEDRMATLCLQDDASRTPDADPVAGAFRIVWAKSAMASMP